MSRNIFVFGSNEDGYHGLGAAKTARHAYGAVMGISYGMTGSSFAIPTKDSSIRNTLPLNQIEMYVQGFIAFAIGHPEMVFEVTRIGCGLAGLKDEQVAPMFKQAVMLPNVGFDTAWLPWLGEEAAYWGTY